MGHETLNIFFDGWPVEALPETMKRFRNSGVPAERRSMKFLKQRGGEGGRKRYPDAMVLKDESVTS